MTSTYNLVKEFKKKYSSTICWRMKKHAKIIDMNLHPGEKVLYAFAAQNDSSNGSLFNTAVLALTSERLLVAQDRILIGYKISSITPDLYNDLQVNAGIIWGVVTIDTAKETVYFSNISKAALSEIQINISSFMIDAKKRFYSKEDEKGF